MATITVTGTLSTNASVSVSVTGLSNSTAYNWNINDVGGLTVVPFTSDGSGNGSTTYVPAEPGSVTITITEVPTTQATTTFSVGDNL